MGSMGNDNDDPAEDESSPETPPPLEDDPLSRSRWFSTQRRATLKPREIPDADQPSDPDDPSSDAD